MILGGMGWKGLFLDWVSRDESVALSRPGFAQCMGYCSVVIVVRLLQTGKQELWPKRGADSVYL